MTQLLVRLFMRDSEDVRSTRARECYGQLAGWVGIASNLVLFVAKLLIGLFTGSISILADATNNLSDCASSVITLVGFKLSSMPADEQHPYGHARFEYISGLVVSFLIIAIGFEFFISSVRKISNPEPVEFSTMVSVVLLLSILIKWWQGGFNKTLGKRIGSETLIATAADSRNDVIATVAVLIGTLAEHFFGWKVDGYMGVAVAAFILISGVKLVGQTLNPLLGMAPDQELVTAIESKILDYDSVIGLHDLVVHNYGPEHCFASVHVEVPARQDIMISHDIIDNIERDFAVDMGIELVIHLDPIITNDERANALHTYVDKIAKEIDPVLTIHDFRMVEGQTHTNLIFDIVLPPRYKLSDAALREELAKRIRLLDESYSCVIKVDRSYTSTTNKLKGGQF